MDNQFKMVYIPLRDQKVACSSIDDIAYRWSGLTGEPQSLIVTLADNTFTTSPYCIVATLHQSFHCDCLDSAVAVYASGLLEISGLIPESICKGLFWSLYVFLYKIRSYQ